MVFTIYGRGGHIGRDMDFAIKLEMPLHKEAPHKISSGFREEDCGRRRRRTTDHGHPISSPCEPSAQVS